MYEPPFVVRLRGRDDRELAGMSYDEWFRESCLPILDSGAKVCLAHLQRYLDGPPPGGDDSFLDATLHYCVEAATELAIVRVRKRASPLYARCQAMSLLVFVSQWMEIEIPEPELQALLGSVAAGPDENLAMLGLIRGVASHADLWPRLATSVRQALKRASRAAGITRTHMPRGRDGVQRLSLVAAQEILSRRPGYAKIGGKGQPV
ncbi:MAG TPA: hypothetical protein VFJ58_27025 [Armatimonadota bacterium]|nr:hypothetical protein [Armatimonadota bacterium]